jgi:hypothetical protein
MHNQTIRFEVDLKAQIAELSEKVKSAQQTLSRELGEMPSKDWKRWLTPAWKRWLPLASGREIEEEMNRSPQISRFVWNEIVDRATPVILGVLESLNFDQMDFRHSKIRDAHPNTFSWMFSQHFKSWLKDPEPIYWISGKPGSGKSTLMKYLVDNCQTPIQLRQWSGSQKLVI